MKNHDLVWIPFFGIYLTKFNPFIIKYEPWVSYQLISIIIFGGWMFYSIFKIATFLMLIF